MEENKNNNTCIAVPVTPRERHDNELWYTTIPYPLQRNSTRNIVVVHIIHPKKRTKKDYYTKKGKKGPKGGKKGKKQERKRKETKKKSFFFFFFLNESKNNHACIRSQGAHRVPRGQCCCLLVFRSIVFKSVFLLLSRRKRSDAI